MIKRLGFFSMTTAAAKVLPAVPLLSLAYGIAIATNAEGYQLSASWKPLLHWLPAKQWAMLWIVLGVIQIVLIATRNRRAVVWAVSMGVFVWTVWSLIFVYSWYTVPDALIGGPVTWAFIAWVHYALAMTLNSDTILHIKAES